MRKLHMVIPTAALIVLFAMALMPPVYASTIPPAIRAFSQCVLAHQNGSYHAATLAEAELCAPSVREIDESGLGSLTLDSPAILKRRNGSAALVGLFTSPLPVGSILASCWNTWANPVPKGTSGIDYVSLNVYGYGNHCGYANVPNNPTVYATCFVPYCNATWSSGRYDSNYGAANFNDRRAAGWANINFNIGDAWICRGYVDTNGNPAGFCS